MLREKYSQENPLKQSKTEAPLFSRRMNAQDCVSGPHRDVLHGLAAAFGDKLGIYISQLIGNMQSVTEMEETVPSAPSSLPSRGVRYVI